MRRQALHTIDTAPDLPQLTTQFQVDAYLLKVYPLKVCVLCYCCWSVIIAVCFAGFELVLNACLERPVLIDYSRLKDTDETFETLGQIHANKH